MIEAFHVSAADNDKGRHATAVMNIISNFGIRTMAEVGVYKGELMRVVLRSPLANYLKHYYAIDPWEVHDDHWHGATKKQWDGMYWSVAKYMPWFPALKVIRMVSTEAARMFPDSSLDFVYIDGDHAYESVRRDIAAWLPKVRNGGLIGGHDYVNDDSKITSIYDVRRAVKEAFGDDFETWKSWTWYKVVK